MRFWSSRDGRRRGEEEEFHHSCWPSMGVCCRFRVRSPTLCSHGNDFSSELSRLPIVSIHRGRLHCPNTLRDTYLSIPFHGVRPHAHLHGYFQDQIVFSGGGRACRHSPMVSLPKSLVLAGTNTKSSRRKPSCQCAIPSARRDRCIGGLYRYRGGRHKTWESA
ncbi:hypothetical protein M011DRAFT_161504 [Sporormia fimetaria CBS 119925]|uniref:Uncharacterized protein n=1 Tax=Sporormia fimetaria CBS 119925 TaxID=1340428 RepID=A0A6A6V318_9PLEO|nr:hypothetical protein M011DRAFT_161504 [Sporormia fimetaria CBS 119925]